MRPVDFQSITAQTPGVERSHQNRPQQPEAEQRVSGAINQEAQDQKTKEAQQTPETRGSQIQLNPEQERKAREERKRKQKEEEKKKEEELAKSKKFFTGKKIDLRI